MIQRTVFIKMFWVTVFLFLFHYISVSQPNEHTILVIHSYHQGLEWTDNITKGIQEVFADRYDVNLIFEYLDAKRNYSPEYYKALSDIYKTKALQIPFDAIIVSDNVAYSFMQQHSKNLYPNIPIIFCGVNDLDTTELKDYPNFIGIGEQADHLGTISAIEHCFPERTNVLVINDNTTTGTKIRNELDEVLKDFDSNLKFEFVDKFTLVNLQNRVRRLDDSYVIYLLVINRDSNGNFISYSKGINKIKEASAVPIFGSWDFYEGKGLFGGKITRGKDQGKYVAEIARCVVDEGSIADYPKYTFLESTYVFDYREMTAYGITKKELPARSLLINKPKRYETLLTIASIVIVVLCLSMLFLFVRIRIKKQKASELEKIVKERTLELSQANKELSEVVRKKDQFFSILAHDLRSSVNVFQTHTFLLNDEEYQADPELNLKIRNELQIIANQTAGITDDLLYWGLSQFENNSTLQKSTFKIETIIMELADRCQINSNKVRFEISCEADVTLHSDINICRFIFRNIIQNAIKFSELHGIVKIESEKTQNGAKVKIKDEGIGMSHEIVKSIFAKAPVKRLGVRGQKSMGIGLPTVLIYLEQINGSLNIESMPNVGSVFSVEIDNLA